MKKERKLIIAGNWEMNKAVGEVDMTSMREKSLSVVEASAGRVPRDNLTLNKKAA
jgi:hypothetical protein